jgi:hypothetical protein
MKKIKLAINIVLLPLSLIGIVLITLLEDPWSPIEFHGFGFDLN